MALERVEGMLVITPPTSEFIHVYTRAPRSNLKSGRRVTFATVHFSKVAFPDIPDAINI